MEAQLAAETSWCSCQKLQFQRSTFYPNELKLIVCNSNAWGAIEGRKREKYRERVFRRRRIRHPCDEEKRERQQKLHHGWMEKGRRAAESSRVREGRKTKQREAKTIVGDLCGSIQRHTIGIYTTEGFRRVLEQ